MPSRDSRIASHGIQGSSCETCENSVLDEMRLESAQMERLKSVADLSLGVTHNFNNLLQIILGNAHLALTDLDFGNFNELRSHLEEIVDSCRLGAKTVKRLQDYARTKTANWEDINRVIDISEVVTRALELAKPWWKDNAEKRGVSIKVIRNLNDDCLVRGSRTELFEVVFNLVKNATEALPDGGRIEVRTLVRNDRVLVEVQDNGVGIPEDNLDRIFEPFFSTKEDEGTGMGLTASYGIMVRHGGTLSASSVSASKTVFTMDLPRSSPVTHDVPSVDTRLPEQLRILIIDDSQPILSLLQRCLEKHDYRVSTALSGREGIDILNNHDIDLVICDLGMPEMNGWQVAEAVMRTCRERSIPRPRFIMLTGWGKAEIEGNRKPNSGVDAVISKPVSSTNLLDAIRRLWQSEHGETKT